MAIHISPPTIDDRALKATHVVNIIWIIDIVWFIIVVLWTGITYGLELYSISFSLLFAVIHIICAVFVLSSQNRNCRKLLPWTVTVGISILVISMIDIDLNTSLMLMAMLSGPAVISIVPLSYTIMKQIKTS